MKDDGKVDTYKEVDDTELSTSTTSTDLVTQTVVSYATDVERSSDQMKRLDYLMGSLLLQFY